ncbi:pca operon transcription factor PcaQ [compost metagenome]
MGAALPVLLARAVGLLKDRHARATVLVEEGDLTHLLPKLRLRELDLIVGRLEPGYAAPDLVTEALYEEPMVVVVKRGHKLARKTRPGWADLAAMPCVLPPPWASLRVKIEQAFYRYGLHPPQDVIETSSYLALATFVVQRGAAGFMAQSVAHAMQAEGKLQVLSMEVPVELPPVGIITLRERAPSLSAEQMLACLRQAAAEGA